MRCYQASDYNQVYEWCRARGIRPIPAWSLPPTGFIVDNVAVGFLIMTDNECGILDFFLTSPKALAVDRAKSLEMITKELISCAKDCSIRMILCDSKVKSIQKLADKLGFKSLGKSEFFSKELI